MNVTAELILNAVPLVGEMMLCPTCTSTVLVVVTSRVGAGYRDGVDATDAAAGAFGTQPDVVFINELPVWRSIAVTRPVNRLVARDVVI